VDHPDPNRIVYQINCREIKASGYKLSIPTNKSNKDFPLIYPKSFFVIFLRNKLLMVIS